MSSRWGLSGTTPVDANGVPSAVLGTLTFYVTGTTTPTDAYSNAGLTSALANPYTLGADGQIPDVFLTQVRYKILVKDADGNTLDTYDPVDKSIERIKAASAPSPAYPGLQYHNTSDGHLYERDSTNASWIDRGTVDSLLNAATVADQFTGTSTALASTPASVGALWLAGTAVSISANNISLPATGGGVFSCSTATTTLTTISSSTEGREIEIIFSNSHTITHGSGINTLGQITYTVPAGARVRFRRNASSWTITRQSFVTTPGQIAYIGTQRFTASGTYTRSKGCAYAFVRTVGPGGGGSASATSSANNGSMAGGGGAGGYCEEWVAPGATETVTIGTGGVGGTTTTQAGTNGSAASSFGSFHSAGAGSGAAAGMANGAAGATSAGGAGGTATGGGVNIDGQAGQAGSRWGNSLDGHGYAGAGGGSILGRSGPVGWANAGAASATAGTGYGAGGTGGAAEGSAVVGTGANGLDGICIVDEYGMV